MLVFSAIVPHSPMLIPVIGKDNTKKLKKTISAFDILEADLNEADPDTIIVISPHGEINFEAFTVNTNEKFTAHFNDFGDFSTKLEFKSDLNLTMQLKRDYESTMPIQLVSTENLDHGISVPLHYLTRQNKDRRIVPINYSYLSFEKHVEFGKLIKEAIFSTDKKYAIIASGDLSHRLNRNSPEGFSPRAKEFDKKLIQLLKKKNVDNVLNMDKELIKEASECGLRSILVLLGAVANMNYEFEVLSYEAPFGVGYLVGEMRFK